VTLSKHDLRLNQKTRPEKRMIAPGRREIISGSTKIRLIFLLVIGFSVPAFPQNADINLLRVINGDRNTSLDPAFKFVTNSVLPMAVAIPSGFITYALLKKDSTSKSNAIIVCSSLVITGIITTSLKYAINRERPYNTYPFIQQVTPGGGPSFPSGHTSTAFSLATSVSLACPKWYVIAPSFLWAGAVGYSRMDLGVHYPSDVLAGAVIGSGSAFLSFKLNRWINKKRVVK